VYVNWVEEETSNSE